MTFKDELSQKWSHEKIWQKYCGFLDLSLPDFMEIQKHLLLEHIDLVCNSSLTKKLMPSKLKDVSEFRQSVPLTTFDDYAADLNEKNEDVLAVKPYVWGHTSGRGAAFKWVPYTQRAVERFVMFGAAMAIMACTTKKGEVNIGRGLRSLQNMPPAPYMAGILNRLMQEDMDIRIIPPLDKYENVDFATRTRVGFQMALRTGVDMIGSLTSVLVKMCDSLAESSGQPRLNRDMLYPQIMWRLIRAVLRSKKEGRDILPKDLWPLKGLVAYGTDTAIYREQLLHCWGKEPFEIYAATEVGVIAMHAWNKKNMTFVPFSCFLEFVPEEEWLKSRENKDHHPTTVLLDEVQPGKRYEVIVSSFYGMPFLRYRLGDLITIVAMEDKQAGIKLPQMVFHSRADDLIDIAGFPRLDEKTIWQAIANTKVKFEDWTIRKEYDQNKPVLRLYIELKEKGEMKELEELIHQELITINRDYKDLGSMLDIQPLKVVFLSAGSFQRYYEEKQKAGFSLAHLKPRHMNAPDTVIQDLLRLAQTPPKR